MFKKFILIAVIVLSQIVFSQTTSEYKTTDIDINSLISGTLHEPVQKKIITNLAILIAGSGPTDRNGNQSGMTNNSLKFLAQELSKTGTAVFSFDKRIIMQMKTGAVDESKLSFDDMVYDAVSVVDYFAKTKSYKNIIIAGHSEGSLIGMLAAKKNVQGLISIAGPGRPINEILEEQILKQLPNVKEELHQKLEILKEGKTFDPKTMNQYIAPLFRESVQPYLISWIKYNPQIEIQKLQMPVLIINGDSDLQVPISDAELLKNAKPNATIFKIPKMNHIFKEISGVAADNMASYNNGLLPISMSLVEKINVFLNELK